MAIISGDNAYTVNKKLSKILNNEDEKQTIENTFKIENYSSEDGQSSITNQNETSYSGKIDYKNNVLCTKTNISNLFDNTKPDKYWAGYSLSDGYLSRELEFDKSLSNTMITILFTSFRGLEGFMVNTEAILYKYPYILLPKDIQNYKLVFDYSDENHTYSIKIVKKDNPDTGFYISHTNDELRDIILLFNRDILTKEGDN